MNKAKQKPKSRNQHTAPQHRAQGQLCHVPRRDTCPAMQEALETGERGERTWLWWQQAHKEETVPPLTGFCSLPSCLASNTAQTVFCYFKVTGADCGLFPLRFCPLSGMYITNAKKDKRKEKSTHRQFSLLYGNNYVWRAVKTGFSMLQKTRKNLDAEKVLCLCKNLVCLKFCSFGTSVYLSWTPITLSSNPRLEITSQSFACKSCSASNLLPTQLFSPVFMYVCTNWELHTCKFNTLIVLHSDCI